VATTRETNGTTPAAGASTSAEPGPAQNWAALLALLAGNFITGVVVLAPTGMLNEVSAGLSVSLPSAGLLITLGAIVLCIGSPLVVWATAVFDRRLLLATSLALVALGHVAAALAPDFTTLLVSRLLMLVAAAAFTPQAASTVALMLPERHRASAISFVFLGWSLSVAAGLPIVTLLAAHVGWRVALAAVAVVAVLVAALVASAIPRGLRGAPLSLVSWAQIVRNRRIVLILVITAFWMAGYFLIFAYFAPVLSRLTGASPTITAWLFALSGVMAVLGNVAATRLVNRLGQYPTALVFLLALFFGAFVWAVGAGSLVVMGAGAALAGLGFAAFNSVQQGRLVTEAPTFASASVALNTSCIYVGQALGSGIASALYSHDALIAMGYAATAFMLAALAVLALTRPSIGRERRL
jgi:DHA1 family inner membrane transport protein